VCPATDLIIEPYHPSTDTGYGTLLPSEWPVLLL
jgi:hypothetical protein